MKSINVIIRQDLFDILHVKVGQLNCYFVGEEDFRLCGSVSVEANIPEGYRLHIKACMCDEEGGILHTIDDFFGVNLDIVNYDTFSLHCSYMTRFFSLDKLHHVELFPSVIKKKHVNK